MIGPIQPGMSVHQLDEVFEESAETFKRVPDDIQTVHAYDAAGVHVNVDQHELVRAITVFQPNEVVLCGVQLLGRSLQSVVEELVARALRVESVDAGAWLKTEDTSVLLIEVDGVVDGVEVAKSQ